MDPFEHGLRNADRDVPSLVPWTPLSEWARDVLLKATKPNAGEQTVLAEVLAMRTILLNMHFAVSQGQTLTAEEMQQLIERADQNKLSKARQRLAEAATGGMP